MRHKTLDAYRTSRPHRTNSRQNLNGGNRRPNSSFVSSLNKSKTNQSVGKRSLLKTEDGQGDSSTVNRHYASLVTENKQPSFARTKTVTGQYITRVNNLNNNAINTNLQKIMQRENQYNTRPLDSVKAKEFKLNKSRKMYLDKRQKEKV